MRPARHVLHPALHQARAYLFTALRPAAQSCAAAPGIWAPRRRRRVAPASRGAWARRPAPPAAPGPGHPCRGSLAALCTQRRGGHHATPPPPPLERARQATATAVGPAAAGSAAMALLLSLRSVPRSPRPPPPSAVHTSGPPLVPPPGHRRGLQHAAGAAGPHLESAWRQLQLLAPRDGAGGVRARARRDGAAEAGGRACDARTPPFAPACTAVARDWHHEND